MYFDRHGETEETEIRRSLEDVKNGHPLGRPCEMNEDATVCRRVTETVIELWEEIRAYVDVGGRLVLYRVWAEGCDLDQCSIGSADSVDDALRLIEDWKRDVQL